MAVTTCERLNQNVNCTYHLLPYLIQVMLQLVLRRLLFVIVAERPATES